MTTVGSPTELIAELVEEVKPPSVLLDEPKWHCSRRCPIRSRADDRLASADEAFVDRSIANPGIQQMRPMGEVPHPVMLGHHWPKASLVPIGNVRKKHVGFQSHIGQGFESLSLAQCQENLVRVI